MGLKTNIQTETLQVQTQVGSAYDEKLFYFGKRMIDIAGAFIGLILSIPVIMVIKVFYIIMEKQGPIIFKQRRIGLNGKVFHIYKIRTMVMNAEEKLKSNHELYKKYIESNYKLATHEDPRITKIGRFLRKTSLDELPQFINVLKGEMSLVGPRPIVEEELKEYKFKEDEFLSVKPGLTGYWQVCGRSNVGYPERVDIELYYVYNKSLKMDIKILIKTVLIVLKRSGAY